MFNGSICALITPFRDGAVDEEAYEAFVDWQIEEGTNAVVPCGTTGESPTLSHEEHRRVTEICIGVAKGRVPVIAGTGSNCTEEAIDLTRHAREAGADAGAGGYPLLQQADPEGLYRHYKALNDEVDIPIIIYNIPGRSIVDMKVETMARLAELPNIVASRTPPPTCPARRSSVSPRAPISASSPARTSPSSASSPRAATAAFP